MLDLQQQVKIDLPMNERSFFIVYSDTLHTETPSLVLTRSWYISLIDFQRVEYPVLFEKIIICIAVAGKCVSVFLYYTHAC